MIRRKWTAEDCRENLNDLRGIKTRNTRALNDLIQFWGERLNERLEINNAQELRDNRSLINK